MVAVAGRAQPYSSADRHTALVAQQFRQAHPFTRFPRENRVTNFDIPISIFCTSFSELRMRDIGAAINQACGGNRCCRTKEQMLYERWQKIIRHRRHEVALRDLASGRCWTFAQLEHAAETPAPVKSAMICPQGHSAEFIFAVLRAWRCDAVVCPVEPYEQPPSVPPPPPPCCHLKITSATTGAPRTIAFTGEQLAADADNIVATMGLRPDWPNLGAISLAHSYGFSNLVLPLLLHGVPLFLAPSPLPEVLRSAAQDQPEPHARRRPGTLARLARSPGHSAQRSSGHLRGRAPAAGIGTGGL